jgi:hypothetical protein
MYVNGVGLGKGDAVAVGVWGVGVRDGVKVSVIVGVTVGFTTPSSLCKAK